MFPRRERFPRKAFPAALKDGQRLSSKHFSVVFPKEGKGYAVVIPKKITRLSSVRHRIKRQVRAVLRTFSLPSALIIFPKTSAGSVSYKDMQTELKNLLS